MTTRIFVTGGHFTPAMAVIEELLKRGGFEIYYLGRKYSMEDDKALAMEFSELSCRTDLTYYVVQTGRLQRKFFVNFWQSVRSILRIPFGFLQAFYLILRYRPVLVLSFGGYVAVPVVFVAWLFGLKIVIHEQTLVCGLSNKLMALLADRVLVSWEDSLKFFPAKKTVLVGNPVRGSILRVKRKRQGRKKVIYVTGGNQGSHVINVVILSILPELLRKYEVIHQTGDSKFGDYEKLAKAKDVLSEPLKRRYVLKKFIATSEIADVFSKVDLIVGRPGANLVTEALYLGINSVLIPISWAGYKEQEKNAQILSNLGRAIIISEDKLSGEKLLKAISDQIIKKGDNLLEFQQKESIAGAAGKIVNELEFLLKDEKA